MVNVLSKVNVNDQSIEILARQLHKDLNNYVREENKKELDAFKESLNQQVQKHSKDLEALKELELSLINLKNELGFYDSEESMNAEISRVDDKCEDLLKECLSNSTTYKYYNLDRCVTRVFIHKELILSNSKSLKTAYTNTFNNILEKYMTHSIKTGVEHIWFGL
jgi:septal ring factor EnvC (AmiA/AmiB activator)